MKRKCLLMILALMLLLLSACVQKKNAIAPTVKPTQPTTQPFTMPPDYLQMKAIVDDVTWYQVFIDENGVRYGDRAIQTLSDGTYLVDGVKTGIWQMSYNTVQFDMEGRQVYALCEANGVYYLEGNGVLWTSDASVVIPFEMIEITPDNWNEYFQTDLCPVIKWQLGAKEPERIDWEVAFILQESYVMNLVSCEITSSYTINGVPYYCEASKVMNISVGGVYYFDGDQFKYMSQATEICGFVLGGLDYGEVLDFQVSAMEGTLMLVDLPLQVLEIQS